MARQFDLGRQNETLMNEQHYEIFKIMENYLKQPNPENFEGPFIEGTRDSKVQHNSLWLDSYNNPASADLKYFNGTNWNVLFKDKFKLTQFLLHNEQPPEPIAGQLWIDNGTLKYYEHGEFKPVKAVPYDIGSVNPLGFEDFIIISPMEAAKDQVIDNFSEFLFAETPIIAWNKNTRYKKQQGAIYDLHIYICKVPHTSSDEIPITNKEYWSRLDFLNQFLVPNTYQDKFFINGNYIPQKIGWVEEDGVTPDDSDIGYSVVTNTCISFPVEMVSGKFASAVHVNPARLHNVSKKFIRIDKKNPIIEVPEDNTEFYGVQGGIGRLLIKTDSEFTSEYVTVVSNNIKCIKLSQSIADQFDFLYAIHYEFITTKVKAPGKLYKRKFKLQDDNYVWIGSVDPDRVCVFAQGLYYERDPKNYIYDSNSGYLYIKEKLQDYDNMVKTFDFSVLAFPKVYQGQITNNFDPTLGYRVNLPNVPISNKLIAFAAGVQLHLAGEDVLDDPKGNPRIKYIPSITADMYASNQHMFWAVVEIDEYNNDGDLIFEMWRGKVTAVNHSSHGVIVPIFRNKEQPVKGAIYFGENDHPIIFVNGVLVFQKEIEVGNDYIRIYGLKAGQDVVVLADSKDNQQSEFENSDRLIFEDTVSYATIPTEINDATVVYLQNGVLCDASSVYTSVEPKDEGYHGEVRLWINYSTEQWMIYDGALGKWNKIRDDEEVIDPSTGFKKYYIDILDQNSRGYSSTRKSISFLKNLGKQVCSYYAYLYADSIEKPLLMEYCYPNGKDGINNDYPEVGEPTAFKLNYRHLYTSGKNELTVYLNGLRQNLDTPFDVGHSNSKNKECRTDRNDEFTLAFDDGTNKGDAIDLYDGYFVYILKKSGLKDKTICLKVEMTTSEKDGHIKDGWSVTLLSTPNKNSVFYVVEGCESGEMLACERKTLTYKDSLSAEGAYANNTYYTGSFLLTRGNIRVFVNGIRQPFGYYQTQEALDAGVRKSLEAYRIIDARTIEFKDVLVGGMGGNVGDLYDPLFPIGNIITPDGSEETVYHTTLDEIVIETRRDYKLREITLPIKDNTGEFNQVDGVPADLFKTKDRVMIYINGLAYGKEYKIENETIKLLNEELRQQLGNSKKDVITFEWR